MPLKSKAMVDSDDERDDAKAEEKDEIESAWEDESMAGIEEIEEFDT